MRIVRIALLALAVLVAASGLARAQEVAAKFALSPQLGLGVPTGDFADTDEGNAATMGFAVGGSGEYFFSENVAVGGKFFYDRFGMDLGDMEDFFGYYGVDLDGNWSIIEFGAYLKYVLAPGNPTRFFGRAGVIMGKMSGTIEVSAEGVTADVDMEVPVSLGLELGIGVMHMFSDNMGFVGEAGFTHLMTDGKDVEIKGGGEIETIESDINTQWFGVKAGICVFLGGK